MMTRFAFCLSLFFSCLQFVSATHIVGGEITYKCLGGNQYEITLIVYRDCYTGVPWFDNPASVGIFDSQWNLVDDLTLFWDPFSNDTLPIILNDPCLTVPPDVCAHGTTYKAVVNLPKIPGGYSLVYQRCCRNQLIRNIIGPLRTGITIITYISEEALDACNSSATFNQWPPVAICIHQPIDFDHSATDPDGDSLVYRLCTPLAGADSLKPIPQPPNPGPYKEVDWRTPYDLNNVLGGVPLTIDPVTGFLTGVPNLVGNYVVGICADEYRDGELISTTRRDFQYNVSDCGQPIAAFFVPEVVCDTLEVKFLNQGLQNNSYQWFFDWGGDTTLTSTSYSPSYVFPDTGYYTVGLIAQSKPTCRDTFTKTIYLTNSYIRAWMNFTFPDCDENGLLVQAGDLSTDTVFDVASWQWTLTGPGGVVEQSSEQSPSFVVEEPGQHSLKLVATSKNGCTDMVNFLFFPPIPPINLLQDSVFICPGESVFLFPDADTSFTHLWSPAASLSDPTAANPLASPSVTTDYTVTITSDNSPCEIEKTVRVVVADLNTLQATASPDTIFQGETSQLNASMPGALSFKWQPPGTLSNPNIASPVASPDETTDYIVSVPIAGSCTFNDTVRVVVRALICDEPFVFFPTGFSPNADGENDELKLESNIATEVYWVIYNRWGEKIFEATALDDAWDGSFRGKPQPAETYGYYLRVGCIGGETLEKKGNVTLLR